jgi:hypothetical protein
LRARRIHEDTQDLQGLTAGKLAFCLVQAETEARE